MLKTLELGSVPQSLNGFYGAMQIAARVESAESKGSTAASGHSPGCTSFGQVSS